MKRGGFSPPQFLVLSISGLIAGGTLLLWLPVSAAPGHSHSLLDAVFTATSAVCVTGLIVIDTPVGLSVFGQAVVLLLIQLGGLGYMTIATVVATAVGRHISVQERLTLQESLQSQTLEGLARFAVSVLKITAIFELVGALVLALRWWGDLGVGQAAWFGLFHAVSAFNNAGFSLFSASLVPYRADVIVNLAVAALIVAGGIGFVVLTEIGQLRRQRRPLSLHVRLVLVTTAVLIAGGTLAIFLLERGNARTLASMGAGEGALAALFQSVSARTAGFNTLDVGAMTTPALFVIMVLMFIGAGPGSTAGGVKVSTFAITVIALWAMIRGVEEPSVFKRRLPRDQVARAFFICLIAFLALNGVAVLLLIAEQRDLLPTLFEATSAFGTVGLSTGEPGTALSLAGGFSLTGKLLLAGMMFLGRVGPLTVAVALAGRPKVARLRYPEGKVLIG